MIINDAYEIGNKLLAIRKKAGLTQAEVARAAGISERTYADFERGTSNMRLQTFLRICKALLVTPDDILTEKSTDLAMEQQQMISELEVCSPRDRETALNLLAVYIRSIQKGVYDPDN